MLQKKIWQLCQLFPETSKSNGKLMMELYCVVIGTQQTIWLFLEEKIASIEFGINMEDNFTILLHMITSLQASNGPQMETILLLAHLRCWDFVIELDGLTHLISLNVAQFWIYHGVMMEQLLLVLEEMDKLYLEILLIEIYNGLTLKQFLIQRTKSPLMIVSMKWMMTLTLEKEL